jgi:hypothetical protein
MKQPPPPLSNVDVPPDQNPDKVTSSDPAGSSNSEARDALGYAELGVAVELDEETLNSPRSYYAEEKIVYPPLAKGGVGGFDNPRKNPPRSPFSKGG